ncbi:MAG: hypothetical protein ABH870_05070 [bacterium]
MVVVDEAACCGDRACPCLRETDGDVVVVDGVGADVWTACFGAVGVSADAGVWAVCFVVAVADDFDEATGIDGDITVVDSVVAGCIVAALGFLHEFESCMECEVACHHF